MEAGRRQYDGLEVDPVIAAFVERRLTDTRHTMRGEFTSAMLAFTNQMTELTTVVTQGNLRQTEEHGQVRGELRELGSKLADMRDLPKRVAQLEGNDRADHDVRAATEALWEKMWRLGLGLGMLVVAAAGVVVGTAH